MKKLIVILLIPLIAISCSLSQTEMIGLYDWNNGQKGQLKINPNNTYSYYFNLEDSDTIKNTGIWEFDSVNKIIIFHDFKFSQKDNNNGTWISRVHKSKNEIHLMYASDSDIYLKKNK
jgi:hypothetical protein